MNKLGSIICGTDAMQKGDLQKSQQNKGLGTSGKPGATNYQNNKDSKDGIKNPSGKTQKQRTELSEQEKAKCKAESRCFTCGGTGHMS
jgi:hypothetical protein